MIGPTAERGAPGSTITDADRGSPAHAQVTLTPMRHRHLEAVLAIEEAVQTHPWTARLFEDELERPNRHYVVARIGSTVIGYAGLLMIVDDGHVATVAVDPSEQGTKVATRLLLELTRGALLMGANQLTLEVRVTNTRAQSLYQRFGFVPAGARKAYYADNGEDAIVMWAHDIGQPAHADRLAAIEASLPSPPTARIGFDTVPAGPPRPTVVHPGATDVKMEP